MIKVAIIGCGGIANSCHSPAYKSGRAKVVAVCDIIPEKMDKIEKTLGYSVAKFTSYQELIGSQKIDMVDICTPNYLHADIAIYALDKGVNVFSEKPDTISVDKALAMQTAQVKSGKHLMVMRNNRYWYSSIQLKKLIDNGDFGDIYTGRCGWIRRRGVPGKGGWFTTNAQSGGGPLIDLGVHMIDLAVYLMGNPKAVAVSGSTYRKFADCDTQDSIHSTFGEVNKDGIFDVEDLAIGFIRFENGASLQLEFSWASNIEKEKNFVELRGSKLGACWEGGAYTLYNGKKVNKFMAKLGRMNQLKHLHNNHVANLNHFFDVLEHNAVPNFEISQGINMIKILTAIYESAKTGKEIQL